MQKTSEIIWQDTHHQTLFEVIDLIKSDGSGEQVMKTLYEYMDNHFVMEETYMRELDYPDYQRHLVDHNKFRDELGMLLQSKFPDDPLMKDAISTYLRNWLQLHVMGIDKELEEFILAASRK